MDKLFVKKVAIVFITSFFVSMPGFSQSAGHKVIRLYQGAAPGSESWNWEEVEKVSKTQIIVTDVSVPTLTVFEPEKSIAKGTAIVVCPGGGFRMLSMTNEGYDVAKWLNSKGITVFILKYRLFHADSINKGQMDRAACARVGVDDGNVAVAYVRNHSSEYGLKTVGIMGFSAGGAVATGVAMTYGELSRPDFVAPIYPGMFWDATAPTNAPPMFIAVATDDNFKLTDQSIEIYKKWVNAGNSAEMHIYRRGGHGFGMKKNGSPTDKWIECFYEWLTDLNLNDKEAKF